ncbi:hypothetical protein AB0E70_11300, partial [Streptomyces murinus]
MLAQFPAPLRHVYVARHDKAPQAAIRTKPPGWPEPYGSGGPQTGEEYQVIALDTGEQHTVHLAGDV